jgi:hypothetical protein
LSQLQSLQILSFGGNKLPGAVNMFGTSPVVLSLVYIASNFIRFLGEIPWKMLRALVQEHSLRQLFLGDNKFTVDTIPEVVGTMTKLEALDLRGLGYTGKSGTSPVLSLVYVASRSKISSRFSLKTGAMPANIGSPGCLPNLKILLVQNNPHLGGKTDASFLAATATAVMSLAADGMGRR